MKHDMHVGTLMLADLVKPTRPRKPHKRILAENQRRAELEAGRRELPGHDMKKAKRFWSYGPAMSSAEYHERGKYLDGLLSERTAARLGELRARKRID
jgi:hypothetical protein